MNWVVAIANRMASRLASEAVKRLAFVLDAI